MSETGSRITAAILAGGRGSRLGGPKATVELAGEPLISRPLRACREAGLETAVVAKPETPLPPLEAAVWREPPQPRHPLCGIIEALRRAGGPVVICGCDMPFLEPALLSWLAALDAELAVPRVEGRLHPLLGRYEPSLLPRLEADLAAELPLSRSVESAGLREIDEAELGRFGEPERLLFNVNGEAELREAESLLAAGAAG